VIAALGTQHLLLLSVTIRLYLNKLGLIISESPVWLPHVIPYGPKWPNARSHIVIRCCPMCCDVVRCGN